MLSALELRLDNVVFRLGLAPTIPSARQLVTHGHIRVNGRKVSYPAYALANGDRIEVRASSRPHPRIAEGRERGPELLLPSYLARDEDGYGGRVIAAPLRADVPIEVTESRVIEFYAR